ncbi:MAG: hypothetical protein HY078_08375 [Elusimicrobia bacterium]|nr:hypothetical protein [Elusimicrobiota bacterium]
MKVHSMFLAASLIAPASAFAAVPEAGLVEAAFQAEKIAATGADSIRERNSRHFEPIYKALDVPARSIPSITLLSVRQKHVGGLWCTHSRPTPPRPGRSDSYSCRLERKGNDGDSDIYRALKVPETVTPDRATKRVSGLTCVHQQHRLGQPGGLGATIWKTSCTLVVPR